MKKIIVEMDEETVALAERGLLDAADNEGALVVALAETGSPSLENLREAHRRQAEIYRRAAEQVFLARQHSARES